MNLKRGVFHDLHDSQHDDDIKRVGNEQERIDAETNVLVPNINEIQDTRGINTMEKEARRSSARAKILEKYKDFTCPTLQKNKTGLEAVVSPEHASEPVSYYQFSQ